MTTLLAFCAIMVAIWSAYKVIKEAKQPKEDRVKRLEEVEGFVLDSKSYTHEPNGEGA